MRNKSAKSKRQRAKYPQVEAIVAEGVRYLTDFSSTIDLLYLDFWTADPEGAAARHGESGSLPKCFGGRL